MQLRSCASDERSRLSISVNHASRFPAVLVRADVARERKHQVEWLERRLAQVMKQTGERRGELLTKQTDLETENRVLRSEVRALKARLVTTTSRSRALNAAGLVNLVSGVLPAHPSFDRESESIAGSPIHAVRQQRKGAQSASTTPSATAPGSTATGGGGHGDGKGNSSTGLQEGGHSAAESPAERQPSTHDGGDGTASSGTASSEGNHTVPHAAAVVSNHPDGDGLGTARSDVSAADTITSVPAAKAKVAALKIRTPFTVRAEALEKALVESYEQIEGLERALQESLAR